jgi:endonuclease YncB( thermonuclease family)
MYRAWLLAGLLFFSLSGPCFSEAFWLASPRYRLYDRAKLVKVEGPNVLRLNMLQHGRSITVRLLGVGSPHNRVWQKNLTPTMLSYKAREHIWERATSYIENLLKGREAEIWARRWNQYDEKNRLLAYILIPSGSGDPLDLNADLIKRGFGFVTRDYVHVTFTGYKILEEEARENRRGVWRGLSPDQISSLTK